MTLRRARLCGNDAHGFTFAREISSSFNGRRRLTGHRRGLAFVAVANPPRFSVFRESAHPFKIPVAPLSAVVSCRNSPFGILSNATRLASSGNLFTGRSRHNEWQKARRHPNSSGARGCWFFRERSTLCDASRDGASHFSTHARDLRREP